MFMEKRLTKKLVFPIWQSPKRLIFKETKSESMSCVLNWGVVIVSGGGVTGCTNSMVEDGSDGMRRYRDGGEQRRKRWSRRWMYRRRTEMRWWMRRRRLPRMTLRRSWNMVFVFSLKDMLLLCCVVCFVNENSSVLALILMSHSFKGEGHCGNTSLPFLYHICIYTCSE